MRYIVTYSVNPGPGPSRKPRRGAIVPAEPAGGFHTDVGFRTREAAERAIARLYELAPEQGIHPVGGDRPAGASYIGAAVVPMFRGVDDAPLSIEDWSIALEESDLGRDLGGRPGKMGGGR